MDSSRSKISQELESEDGIKNLAAIIKKLIADDIGKRDSLNYINSRIESLNKEINKNSDNKRLQKQLLLQLKTMMKKRDAF